MTNESQKGILVIKYVCPDDKQYCCHNVDHIVPNEHNGDDNQNMGTKTKKLIALVKRMIMMMMTTMMTMMVMMMMMILMMMMMKSPLAEVSLCNVFYCL